MRIAIVGQNASTKFGGESLLRLNYFRILRSRNIETWLLERCRLAPGSLCHRRRSNWCSIGNHGRWGHPRGTISSSSSFCPC
ncbi:MAG: hypothetical protein EAZ73_31785 [Oscillatoriales cyanobacterium]|nr:MAG: hypothetical protein EAZ83_00085 [Oscillatoriales cyanobacterium]TAF12455.1 MAG: hypothetical protein EAZ73_31785 [Oscillatoriales cyanobacterium]TAF31335.1 MAG: hypothetical protein EAZ69_19520 [Oscillatoriales cyanobacterium]